jgi:ElaB/YqjD/DUF883 family membrane-anchored ribosome-binding protein
MSARNRYWYAFAEMLYRKYYIESYKQMIASINQLISAFLLLTSSSGIAAWWIWKQYAHIWSALLGFAQVLSLIMPLFHFQEQIVSINYCLPELETLLNDMEKMWQSIDSISECEIIKKQAKFENRFKDLECKYLSTLRDSKHCQKIAMDKRDAYLLPYTAGLKAG